MSRSEALTKRCAPSPKTVLLSPGRAAACRLSRPRITDPLPCPGTAGVRRRRQAAARPGDRSTVLGDGAQRLVNASERLIYATARLRQTHSAVNQAMGANALAADLEGDEEALGVMFSSERFGPHDKKLGALIEVLCDAHRTSHLISLQEVFSGLKDPIGELAAELQKEAVLDLRIAPLSIDERVAKHLFGAVLHLLNNAVDHGLEHPEARRRSGKTAIGRVSLEAYRVGDMCTLTVADDGSGIDEGALIESAARLGLETAPTHLEGAAASQLVFHHGLTTRGERSPVSGRGIGLDAVRRSVEALGGRVSLSTEPGKGTRFTMSVPLELMVETAWVVRVGDGHYALPSGPGGPVPGSGEDRERALSHRDEPTFTVDLRELVGQSRGWSDSEFSGGLRVQIGSGTANVCGGDDPVKREIWVFGAEQLRVDSNDLSSVYSSELGWIAELPRKGFAPPTGRPPTTTARRATARATVLLVEDSELVRDMLRELLEAQGIDVLTATSGEEALGAMATDDQITLMLTDVQMPGMDGIALVRAVSQRVPVIVLSMRDDESDKRRAVEAGAVAYVSKANFSFEALWRLMAPLLTD